MKVVVVLPAYNCAKSLKKTISEIPQDVVNEIVLVDDFSSDDTLGVAEECCIKHIIKHDRNLGYGANQKTCYDTALMLDADIIVMLHPDYQYDPKLITLIIDNKNISKDMQIRSDQSEELFTVSGLENVWVMADVYESDISKVCAGDRVEITTLAYRNRSFGGTIDKVYQVLNDESKTMSVRIKLQNKDYLLKPGMFTNVKVTCKASEERMARIDPHSLVFENGKNYVVAVDGDGSLQVKEVEIYKRSDKECYLRSGVTGGDKILNKNVLLVYNALNDDSK